MIRRYATFYDILHGQEMQVIFVPNITLIQSMKNTNLLIALLFLCCGCQKSMQYEFNAPENFHNRAVGASAAEILKSDRFTSLLVEIQYMAGATPDAASVENLKSFLAAYCNKPSGISVITREIPADAKTTLTINEVYSIEKASRQEYSGDGRIVLYLLYTNGGYTEGNVLGAAYQNTSAVLFSKTITDNSGGIGQPSRSKLETTVLQHEIGHLMGLVDTGTPMQTAHKDPDHGSHCNNSSCLMYYASETTDVLGFLVTSNVPTLDANCIADLKAQGSR